MRRALALGALALAACGSCSRSAPELSGDVVLITVDALRADHISAELTPTLSRLAGEGLSFSNARANSSHPLQSAAALLTGLLPTRGGSIGLLEAAPSAEAETLAETLAEAQLMTGLVSSQPLLGGEGFLRGYQDIQVARPGESWSASEVASRAIEVLEDAGERASFLHVHFADPHEPHVGDEPPLVSFADVRARIAAGATGDERCSPEELESLRAAYRAEVAAVDAAVAELFEAIRARANPDGTLIVFTSTCGEEFLEHGYVGHSWTLHEEALRVPLIFHGPGMVDAAVDAQAVSLVDVAPSLAALLKLPERRIGFDGDALFDGGSAAQLEERETLAELVIRERCVLRAVITRDVKFISADRVHEPSERQAISAGYIEAVRAAAAGELELPDVFGDSATELLYDLKNDPGERTSLGMMSRVSKSQLRAVLDDYREYCAAHGLAPRAAEVAPSFSDSSEADALEALGYL
ncbi:MAG: sulfatase [Planctomycetes bacterium]|nr:sulfatase [Planctomycetota bacterium]